MFARFLVIGCRDPLRVPKCPRKDTEILFDFEGDARFSTEEATGPKKTLAGDPKEFEKLAKCLPVFCYPEPNESSKSLMGSRQFVKKFPIVLTTESGRRVLAVVAYWKGDAHLRETLYEISKQLRRQKQSSYRNGGDVPTTIRLLSHTVPCPVPSTPATASLASLLERFSAESLLKIMGGLLSERRIAIVGKDFVPLASCVVAAVSLVYPFRWQHILLPVVPNHLAAMVLSPVPFVLGLRRGHFNRLKTEYGEAIGQLLVADIDEGTVRVVSVGRNDNDGVGVDLSATVPALDTKMPRGASALKRFKHGAFNCVRLRRDLRNIRSRTISSQGVKGRQVLGSSPAKTKTTQTRVLGIVEGMEHRMGIYRHVIGGLDETSVRVSCVAFFVRVLVDLPRFVRTGRTAASAAKKYDVNMRKFVESQPDQGVRTLLRAMDGSQMLERFVERFMSRRTLGLGRGTDDLEWFVSCLERYDASLSWSDTKKAVLKAFENVDMTGSRKNASANVALDGQNVNDSKGDRRRRSSSAAAAATSQHAETRIQNAKRIQGVMLRLTSNRPMDPDVYDDKIIDSSLETIKKATFDDAKYRSMWPVLVMRLADSRAKNWKHGLKSLFLIQHMLLVGSPRTLADLHSRLCSILPRLMEHENIRVRLKAIVVYRLANDSRLRSWAKTYRPCPEHSFQKLKREILGSQSFAALHKSLRPTVSSTALRSSSSLLLNISSEFDEGGCRRRSGGECVAVESESKRIESDLLQIFGAGSSTIADDTREAEKKRGAPGGGIEIPFDPLNSIFSTPDRASPSQSNRISHDDENDDMGNLLGDVFAQDDADAGDDGNESDFDFGSDFGESLPVVSKRLVGDDTDGTPNGEFDLINF
eukprot:g3875.t1